MSTLNVSNISDGSTSVGTSYVVNGSAKAWVNFNGTGTVAIRDSENVSSITDIGSGSFDINVSASFSDTNYVITTQATKETGQSVPRIYGYRNGDTKTGSTIAILCEDVNTYGNQDQSQMYVVFHGDLA